MKDTKTRNLTFDLIKFLCAFFVCAIHFSPCENMVVFSRIAVPIFFIIDGYFIDKSMVGEDSVKMKQKSISFLKKSIFPIVFYIFCTFITTLCKNNFVDLVYHLWYLSSLVIVQWIYYLILKYKKEKFAFKCIIPLLMLCVIFGRYSNLIILGGGGILISQLYITTRCSADCLSF